MRYCPRNRFAHHDDEPRTVREAFLQSGYDAMIIQQVTGSGIAGNEAGIGTHALRVIIFQAFRSPFLRRSERGVPPPIETVRLPTPGADDPRMLAQVLVHGGGAALLRSEY